MADKIKITKANIGKIKTFKEGIYRDTDLTGFAVRVTSTKQTYIIDKKKSNKLIRKVIGDVGILTPEEARNEAVKLLGDIAKGINTVAEKRKEEAKKITLQQTFTDFIALYEKRLSPHTIYDYERAFETAFKDWHNLPLTAINKNMVVVRFTEISKNAPYQANLSFRFLRRLFNFAMEQYETEDEPLINRNPCDRLKALKLWNKTERRQTYIKEEELAAVWQALNFDKNDTKRTKQAKQQCKICLLTGCREQEAASLKRKDINLTGGFITFEHTKNGKRHILPYGKYLGGLMEELCKGKMQNDYLFPADNKEGHLWRQAKIIQNISAACGVKFTLHDLRRTFISIANNKISVTGYTLKKLVNHAQNDVTAGYIIFDTETLRKPMQDIEDYILHHSL